MSPSRPVCLVPSRELCGTTPEEFAGVLERLGPLVEERRRRLADRPGRRRAPGAGRPPFPLWLRLLVALTLLRQGTSVRATGQICGIHERSVRRYRDEIEELLSDHGFCPPGTRRPIRSLEDLTVYLAGLPDQTLLVDGTEVRRWSPYPWEAQKAAWSGKTKDHVVKATVLSDRHRRPIWVEANPSGEGRTADIAMLRAQDGLMGALQAGVAAGTVVLADRGYPTLTRDLGVDGAITPVYANKHHPDLPQADREDNRRLSSRRMPVEHAIGRMKWWRALTYWRRPVPAFARTIRAIGVLTTLT